jgi:SAM-dependent methyltransferase
VTSDFTTIKADLVTAYEADVPRREAMTPASWRTTIVDDFAARCRAGGRRSVVELGAGTGQLATHAGTRGLSVTPTDLSPGNVGAMRRRGLDASIADFSDLPFDDESFDGGYAVNSLLHVPKTELADVMAEVRRVIRKGGLLMIVVWGGPDHEGPYEDDWLEPPRFFSFYPDTDFVELRFAGFTPVEHRILYAVEESGPDLHPQVAYLEAT